MNEVIDTLEKGGCALVLVPKKKINILGRDMNYSIIVDSLLRRHANFEHHLDLIVSEHGIAPIGIHVDLVYIDNYPEFQKIKDSEEIFYSCIKPCLFTKKGKILLR